jgi:hypothetical protein
MTLTIELALGLGSGILTLLAFWWGLARWIIAELGKRDLAIQAEHARAKMAEDDLRRSLEAHKLYAAENFATTHELANALGRVETAITKLADRLDMILIDKGKGKDP